MNWLTHYDRRYLRGDVAAGIAVLVMLASLTTLRTRTAGSTVTEEH